MTASNIIYIFYYSRYCTIIVEMHKIVAGESLIKCWQIMLKSYQLDVQCKCYGNGEDILLAKNYWGAINEVREILQLEYIAVDNTRCKLLDLLPL